MSELASELATEQLVRLRVNGEPLTAVVEPRTNLADVLREQAGLTGTHTSCHQGWCGACTVLIDGCSARSCLTLAVAATDTDVTTVEGLGDPDGSLTALQEAFVEHFAFQCGFCTPGFLVLATEIIDEARAGTTFTRDDLASRLSANVCRCTGYVGILNAVEAALAAQASEVRS